MPDRDDEPRIAGLPTSELLRAKRPGLGVTDTEGEASVFELLLRGLNSLAEVAPPFQLARLKRHVLGGRFEPEAAFDLQLVLSRREHSGPETSLLVLTRDLAEVFKARVGEQDQFQGGIGRIECLELEGDVSSPDAALRTRWRA